MDLLRGVLGLRGGFCLDFGEEMGVDWEGSSEKLSRDSSYGILSTDSSFRRWLKRIGRILNSSRGEVGPEVEFRGDVLGDLWGDEFLLGDVL